MKKISLLTVLALVLLMTHSCEWLFPQPEPIEANFEDVEGQSIYHFLDEDDTTTHLYGPFFKILNAANIAKTLSAYNPYSEGYTLLLPDSLAVMKYIEDSEVYNSLDDLLNDTEYVTALAKYHIVTLAIDANDFPFGALPAETMTNDYLTVNFAVTQDSGYYVINNQAPVIRENIEQSNGFIHILGEVLSPITYTTADWLNDHPDFSIFNEAVKATGFDELLSLNIKDDSIAQTALTLLLEPDSIYNREGIFSLEDLTALIEVRDNEYTKSSNRLYQYVGYHILEGSRFLDDLYDNATNYTTFADLPLNINGEDFIDIVINKGKYNFDTIVEDLDTTIIDYATFYYDQSNINTLSGAIHLIDQVLQIQAPSRAQQTFQFWDVAKIAQIRNDEEPGEFPFDNPDEIWNLSWVGPNPVQVLEEDEDHPAWNDDYLLLNGSFSITYYLPKIVQGEYEVQIRAHSFGETNAMVEVYLDGTKVGRYLDFSTGGDENNAYRQKTAGTIDFTSYENHEVEIRALIPGRFEWDYVRFTPVTD